MEHVFFGKMPAGARVLKRRYAIAKNAQAEPDADAHSLPYALAVIGRMLTLRTRTSSGSTTNCLVHGPEAELRLFFEKPEFQQTPLSASKIAVAKRAWLSFVAETERKMREARRTLDPRRFSDETYFG